MPTQTTRLDRYREGKTRIDIAISRDLSSDFSNAIAQANRGKEHFERDTKTGLIIDFIRWWITSQENETGPVRLEVTKPPFGITMEEIREMSNQYQRKHGDRSCR